LSTFHVTLADCKKASHLSPEAICLAQNVPHKPYGLATGLYPDP